MVFKFLTGSELCHLTTINIYGSVIGKCVLLNSEDKDLQ